jgi:thioredoxin reductase
VHAAFFLSEERCMQTQDVDCLIIGGGPAGLTAAVYLARYRRNVVVIDSGHSRASSYLKVTTTLALQRGFLAMHCLRG